MRWWSLGDSYLSRPGRNSQRESHWEWHGGRRTIGAYDGWRIFLLQSPYSDHWSAVTNNLALLFWPCYFSLGLIRRRIFSPFLGGSSFISLHISPPFSFGFHQSISSFSFSAAFARASSLRSFSACIAASARAFWYFTAAAPRLFSSSSFSFKDRICSCSCEIWVAYGFVSRTSFTGEANAAALCDSIARSDWVIERIEGVLMLDCLSHPEIVKKIPYPTSDDASTHVGVPTGCFSLLPLLPFLDTFGIKAGRMALEFLASDKNAWTLSTLCVFSFSTSE